MLHIVHAALQALGHTREILCPKFAIVKDFGVLLFKGDYR